MMFYIFDMYTRIGAAVTYDYDMRREDVACTEL